MAEVTLSDIEKISKEFLLATDIAPYLKADVGTIIFAAKNDPDGLGFPVVRTGSRVRFPKLAFINFCKQGKPAISYEMLEYMVSQAIRKREGA